MMLREATDTDRNHATTAPEDQYRTAGERRAEGKALREAAVAREDHPLTTPSASWRSSIKAVREGRVRATIES
jgi:hypothetical protein